MVRDYFGPLSVLREDQQESDLRGHAMIAETFIPGRGWKRWSGFKRISPSWARKMRAEGVTSIALRSGGRTADFRIEELIRP